MVFNTPMIVRVARVSTQAWQWLSCIHDPIDSDQLLDLLCCFPLQQLGRLTLCLCSFFCLPQRYYSLYSSFSDSDDFASGSGSDSGSSSSTLHLEHDYYYHSHSD
ncbi:hypothetical protein L195_g050843, partial [Trifolium pratense]